MLVFGKSNTVPGVAFDPMSIPGITKCVIFNFFSLYDIGIRLDNLIPYPYPPEEIVFSSDELVFDGMYANYLLNNQYAFTDMMKLMYELYTNSDVLVYVLVGDGSYRDGIAQSLVKFIQERYGYVTNYINSIEDLECLQDSGFSNYGLINFDIDMERYQYNVYQSENIEVEE